MWGRKIDTVFIGGGTPSLFSAQAIDDLLAGVRALTNLHPGIEVTMEANPGSAEREKFTDFRAAGINRLSIGVQSFNDEHLQALGRVHDAAQAVYAAEAAHAAGFASFNIDLMFGLPKQSAQQALADIEQAIALSPSTSLITNSHWNPIPYFTNAHRHYPMKTPVGLFNSLPSSHWNAPGSDSMRSRPMHNRITAVNTTSTIGNLVTTWVLAQARMAK